MLQRKGLYFRLTHYTLMEFMPELGGFCLVVYIFLYIVSLSYIEASFRMEQMHSTFKILDQKVTRPFVEFTHECIGNVDINKLKIMYSARHIRKSFAVIFELMIP